MVLRTFPAAMVGALVVSCAASNAPVETNPSVERGAAALACVYDDDGSRTVGAAPEAVTTSVTKALGNRNLAATVVAADAYSEAFARKRMTAHRMEELARLAPDAKVLVLVETKAVFYSHLNGRYRWNVYATTTLGRPGAPQETTTRAFNVAAFMDFAHEREADALAFVAPRIADHVGRLTDDFLGGHE